MHSKWLIMCAGATLALTAQAGGGAKHRFAINGSYVEGCTCAAPCKCELSGVEMGCQGVGAFNFTGGTFDGKSVAGVRTAYATKPGEWVVIYVDAPNASKRAAGEALMRAALADFGKIESVKSAKVKIWSQGNKDFATVDGGKVMNLKTEAMLGGDNKSPLVYSNIHDALHPTVMGGKTLSCTYKDGAHEINLKDSNAYFHHHLMSRGVL